MFAPPNPQRTEAEHRAMRGQALAALHQIQAEAGLLASKIRHPSPQSQAEGSETWDAVSTLGGELAIVCEFLYGIEGGPLS